MERVEIGDCVLICGDALAVLPELEAGSVDCIVADPPYGTKTNQREKWMAGEFANVMPAVLPELYRVGSDNAAFYLFTSWKNLADWIFRCSVYFRMQNLLVFDKGRHSGTWGAYSWQYHWEGVFYGIKGPRKILKYMPDILRTEERPGLPMQKPVDVVTQLLEASTVKSQMVLDPFVGSGSTALACIRTGRRFLGCEISPEYFRIAVRRVEEEYARQKETLYATQSG